jgi:hypothetical protein
MTGHGSERRRLRRRVDRRGRRRIVSGQLQRRDRIVPRAILARAGELAQIRDVLRQRHRPSDEVAVLEYDDGLSCRNADRRDAIIRGVDERGIPRIGPRLTLEIDVVVERDDVVRWRGRRRRIDDGSAADGDVTVGPSGVLFASGVPRVDEQVTVRVESNDDFGIADGHLDQVRRLVRTQRLRVLRDCDDGADRHVLVLPESRRRNSGRELEPER